MFHLRRLAITLTGLRGTALDLAADPLPRSVLVVSQGLPGRPQPLAIHRAFRAALNANTAKPIAIDVEQFDLARMQGCAGGGIWAENRSGGGAAFRLTLPLAVGQPA